MNSKFSYPTKSEILPFLLKLQFRDFTKEDWYTFAGCETKNPKIAEIYGYAVVIDGASIGGVGYEVSGSE